MEMQTLVCQINNLLFTCEELLPSIIEELTVEGVEIVVPVVSTKQRM